MGQVYILLMVFHLHGGSYATQSLTAPSYEQCKTNGSIILQRQIDKGMVMDGKTLKIDSGKFVCMVFE